MNIQDANIANAERDADPVRWRDYDPSNVLESRYETLYSAQTGRQAEDSSTAGEAREDPMEEVERESSISSSGSSIQDGSQIRHAPSTVSRTSTRMESDLMEYLDRHPTAIKRMQERGFTP